MLYSPDEVKQGDTVWLTAHTKTAPPECYRNLQVRLSQPPAKFWPYLVVEWEERNGEGKSESRWLKVHKDDVKKKAAANTTAAEKKAGDTTGGRVDGKWQRKLSVAAPVPNVEGQDTLW